MIKISSSLTLALLLLTTGGMIVAQTVSPEVCLSVLKETNEKTPKSSLQWEKQKLELDSPLGQSIVRTSYRFTNTGKEPVSLVELLPSCGCVSTEVSKLTFAPGETSELKVTLDLAMDDAAGTQERYIMVTTSDVKTPSVLRLLVHVPTPVEFSTNTVNWKIGDKPTAKEVVVNVAPGVEQMKLSTEFQSSDFAVEIKPDASGRTYRVSITPTSTAALCYAQVRLLANSTSFPRPMDYKINLNVN